MKRAGVRPDADGEEFVLYTSRHTFLTKAGADPTISTFALAEVAGHTDPRTTARYVHAARQAVADGYVSGGTRRNLSWVAPHVDAPGVAEEELLLLADAQTSGGLLVAGELPGYPVIGELVPARPGVTVVVR